MKFLLFAISLAEAFIKPISNELISRSSDQCSCSCPKLARAHPGYCESGWTYYKETDACYKNFFLADFSTAESVCITVGGHLTSIHSFKENHFVAELAKSGTRQTACCDWGTWIGLIYLNGNFTWTDGTEVDFVRWTAGEPYVLSSHHCGEMVPDPFEDTTEASWYQTWIAARCTLLKRSFVCKKMALH